MKEKYLIPFLLCFFFGLLGAHRFYKKQWKTGLLMLISLGGLGIWYVYDLTRLLSECLKKEKATC